MDINPASIAMSTPPSSFAGDGGGARVGAQQDSGKPRQPGSTTATGEPLSSEQEAEVRRLKKRDAEVKAHEQAHAAVGGAYASAPKYTYTRGPDGKKYAVGGEVQIDTSPERTPEATIRKMDIVIRAALAPAEPSSQDRAVARQAQQQRLEAQNQVAQMQADERQASSADNGDGDGPSQISSLSSALAAQVFGQSQSETAPVVSGSAASAYQSTAGLAAQLFGGG